VCAPDRTADMEWYGGLGLLPPSVAIYYARGGVLLLANRGECDGRRQGCRHWLLLDTDVWDVAAGPALLLLLLRGWPWPLRPALLLGGRALARACWG
jgi:hypothetical protein